VTNSEQEMNGNAVARCNPGQVADAAKMKLLIGRISFASCLGLAIGSMHSQPAAVVGGPMSGERPLKYEEPTYLSASIYARTGNPDTLLFRFKRVAKRSGSTLEVQREFTYPDGRIANREHVVYHGGDLSSYEVQEAQIGAEGSATIRHSAAKPVKGIIEFAYTKEPGGRTKAHAESLVEDSLVGDMVGPFLAEHWEALMRGEKVKCRYIVISRRETVGFTFIKDSESTWRGQRVLQVKMEPTSRLIAALVDPLMFSIEMAAPHRILMYVGRTTPKTQVDGKWKDQDAITIFDWDSAR